jgi:hypothetical protein
MREVALGAGHADVSQPRWSAPRARGNEVVTRAAVRRFVDAAAVQLSSWCIRATSDLPASSA